MSMNMGLITLGLIILNAPAVQILIAIYVIEQLRKYHRKRKLQDKIINWKVTYS